MSRTSGGTYVRIDKRRPRASAVCDVSGFRVMHHNLVPEMEYNGAGLYNTGMLVEKRFVTRPNPQNMTPYIGPDMKPVPNPRPDFARPPDPSLKEFDVSAYPDVVEQTREQYVWLTQVFIGNRTSDLLFEMPATYATWIMVNQTSGGHTIRFKQVAGYKTYDVEPGETRRFTSVFNDFYPIDASSSADQNPH
jgi:hypothetical protein